MEEGTKRKADAVDTETNEKRLRTKKQWHVPRKNDRGAIQASVIQPGDSGIWATCNKGREGKCVGELRDLFSDYAEELYRDVLQATEPSHADGEGAKEDIEGDIQAEIAGIRRPETAQLFVPVKLNVQCVIFFKTVAPVEPVSFVKRICEDAANSRQRKRTRITKRLSPMTLLDRASTEGLEKVAKQVLAPHFHTEPLQPRTFAIRPTIRNHNILTRDSIIRQIATIVGSGHKVDLNNYDLLIVVEVYQNICGISVVDNGFERLKRFNLAEIFDPTPTSKEVVKDVREALAAESSTDKVPQAAAPAAEPPATSMDLT